MKRLLGILLLGIISLNLYEEKIYADDDDYYFNIPQYVYSPVTTFAPSIREIALSLPIDHETIRINGQTYYVSDGTYYIDHPQGYLAVTPPISLDNNGTADRTNNSFTVDIPDGNGKWITVLIKNSETGSGYVGAKGEYYKDFPTVAQLQAAYL